jgi:hypothetical protein
LEKLSRSTRRPTVHLRIDPLVCYVTGLLAELAVPGSSAPATIFQL